MPNEQALTGREEVPIPSGIVQFMVVELSVCGPDIESLEAAHGPFATRDDAVAWADARPHEEGTDWWTVPVITPPDSGDSRGSGGEG